MMALAAQTVSSQEIVVLRSDFSSSSNEAFACTDNLFRGTNTPGAYASGSISGGGGALEVGLGGVDDIDIVGMSGG